MRGNQNKANHFDFDPLILTFSRRGKELITTLNSYGFFDSSAFVKRYIDEPETDKVLAWCDKASEIISERSSFNDATTPTTNPAEFLARPALF